MHKCVHVSVHANAQICKYASVHTYTQSHTIMHTQIHTIMKSMNPMDKLNVHTHTHMQTHAHTYSHILTRIHTGKPASVPYGPSPPPPPSPQADMGLHNLRPEALRKFEGAFWFIATRLNRETKDCRIIAYISLLVFTPVIEKMSKNRKPHIESRCVFCCLVPKRLKHRERWDRRNAPKTAPHIH